MMLIAQSTKMNAIELSEYADNVLLEKFQTIPGISSVSIFENKNQP
jgi:multidrug efflux pump subunit AcrB